MKLTVTICLLFLIACQTRQEPHKSAADLSKTDSIRQQQHRDSLAKEEEDAVQQEQYKNYWGYRYHIQGDFDGDGIKETLTEKLISERTGAEIAKYCGFEEDTTSDCYWTWRINGWRKPKCLLTCSNVAIKDFRNTSDHGTSAGFEFLQNTGDLNGDGIDEIVYIENLGGCNSILCVGHLATYKKGHWKEILEFSTRLDQYIDLGETDVKVPEDLKKNSTKAFEKKLREVPPVFEKKNGKVYYEEREPHEDVTKILKTNW